MKVKVDGKGNVTVHYSQLKELQDHLRLEHDLPEHCEVIVALGKLWAMGCDAQCAARERNA